MNRQKAIPRDQVMKDDSDFYVLDARLSELALERARLVGSSYFAGADPRRRKEMADAGLVQEDRQAIANLPTKAIHHEYPRFGYDSTYYIADSIIDRGGK